jgi:hypothetical protein
MSDTSNQLDKALTECCARLNECAEIIDAMNSESRNSDIQNIGRAMAEIFELRTNLYKLNPDLKPKGWDDPLSETDMEIMYRKKDMGSLCCESNYVASFSTTFKDILPGIKNN